MSLPPRARDQELDLSEFDQAQAADDWMTAELDQADREDQVELIENGEQPGDGGALLTVLAPAVPQARALAGSYLRELCDDRAYFSTIPLVWTRSRPRRGREPRGAPQRRRLRVRSGSRDRPRPSADDDFDPAHRAVARTQAVLDREAA
jgi:hypothetical protein